jgi:3-oxoacid CoA-transferase
MINKVVTDAATATRDIRDGASVVIGGFGVVQGWPTSLLFALRNRGSSGLTVILNSPGVGPTTAQMLAEKRQIRRLIATFAAYPTRRTPIEEQIRDGTIALEMVPQGTLVERLRAAGAGLAAVYTPTGVGTQVAEGKETRELDGRTFLLETALRADFALVRAHTADTHGNLVYRRGARNFNPIFATAGRTTIAEVDAIVPAGGLDPEAIVTPGIFVDRVVQTEHPLDLASVLDLARKYGKPQRLEARIAPGVPVGLSSELMAFKAARLLRPNEYVNLGLGLPTLVSNFIDAETGITLHSENGMLGFGALASEGSEDPDLYNASGQLVSLLPGASFFHSADAFAMARSGRVTTIILGGFQVAENGDLANWNVPSSGVGGIGGAMDLAAGGARVIVVMFHTDRTGATKLVRRCTYPLTARGCVRTVVTDLALIDIDGEGFLLREVAPGVGVDDVRRLTGAPLRVAADCGEMV